MIDVLIKAGLGAVKGAVTGATGSEELGKAIEKAATSVSTRSSVPLTKAEAPKVAEAIAEKMPDPKAFEPLTPQVFRQVVVALGGALASAGYVSQSDVELYSGLLIAAAPVVWRIFTVIKARVPQ